MGGSAALVAVAAQLALLALLGAAAWIDAARHRLPNGLAAALACAGGVCALTVGGPAMLVRRAGVALVVFFLLAGAEVVWRVRRAEPGVGFGDIKALFALSLAGPLSALTSFAIALVVLATVAIALGREALPLLPFLAATYLLVVCFELASRLGVPGAA